MPDYYEEKPNQKTGDFLIGFLGPLGMLPFLVTFAGILSTLLREISLWIALIVFAVGILWLVFLTFFHKRYYIGLGLLVSIAAALVIGGGCFWMISGWH